MKTLVRLARALRIEPASARHAFRHRLLVGLAVAALILIFLLLR